MTTDLLHKGLLLELLRWDNVKMRCAFAAATDSQLRNETWTTEFTDHIHAALGQDRLGVYIVPFVRDTQYTTVMLERGKEHA